MQTLSPPQDSVSTGANLTAPGAGTVLAGVGAQLPGLYEIRFAASVGAGAVAADNGNVKLVYNGSTQVAAVPTNGAEQTVPRVTLNATNAIQLTVVGAATAAVVYTGRLTVTRIA